MSRRAEAHKTANAVLAATSDERLQELLGTAEGRAGWGMTWASMRPVELSTQVESAARFIRSGITHPDRDEVHG